MTDPVLFESSQSHHKPDKGENVLSMPASSTHRSIRDALPRSPKHQHTSRLPAAAAGVPQATMHFQNIEEAACHLSQPIWRPASGIDGVPANDVARLPYVRLIANALQSVRKVHDRTTYPNSYARFCNSAIYSPEDAEAIAHIVVNTAIAIHEDGATSLTLRDPANQPSFRDSNLTFDERMRLLADLWREYKREAERIMRMQDMEPVICRAWSVTKLAAQVDSVPSRSLQTHFSERLNRNEVKKQQFRDTKYTQHTGDKRKSTAESPEFPYGMDEQQYAVSRPSWGKTTESSNCAPGLLHEKMIDLSISGTFLQREMDGSPNPPKQTSNADAKPVLSDEDIEGNPFWKPRRKVLQAREHSFTRRLQESQPKQTDLTPSDIEGMGSSSLHSASRNGTSTTQDYFQSKHGTHVDRTNDHARHLFESAVDQHHEDVLWVTSRAPPNEVMPEEADKSLQGIGDGEATDHQHFENE